MALVFLAGSRNLTLDMTPPKPKQVSKFAPDILRKTIPQTLERHYSMMSYDGHYGGCPGCKSDHVVGFGWLPKTFCTIITERGGFQDVKIRVRRYLCVHCKHTFLATDAPFYDGCKYGKPIVDLCLALSASNPYNRVESILTQYGIQVDRDTVKNYALMFRERATKKAGIGVMDDSAKIGVNILKMLFDVENVKELKEKYPKAKYDSGAAPSTRRTPPSFILGTEGRRTVEHAVQEQMDNRAEDRDRHGVFEHEHLRG